MSFKLSHAEEVWRGIGNEVAADDSRVHAKRIFGELSFSGLPRCTC